MGSDQGSKSQAFGLLRGLLLPAGPAHAPPRRRFIVLLLLTCVVAFALFFIILTISSGDDDDAAAGRVPRTLLSSLLGLGGRHHPHHQQPFPRVVILVTPSPVPNPGTRYDRLLALIESWGRRHPDHVTVLIPTDDLEGDSGSSSLPADLFLELPAEYGPTDNVGRIKWSLEEATHRIPAADWFMVLNEHTFVIPENLLCFLRRLDGPTQGQQRPSSTSAVQRLLQDREGEGADQKPLFLGHRLTLEDGTAFHSGGAGFLLNRASRDVLLHGLAGGGEGCRAGNEWAKTNAGVTIARCLAAHGVEATSTRGLRGEEGKERFHVFGPCRTAEGAVDEWFVKYHPRETGGVGATGAEAAAAAVGCCAAESVSFHYVGPMEARALARMLYDGGGMDRLRAASGGGTGGRAKAAAINWPVKEEDLGGYARAPSDDSPMWELSLGVCDEGL